MRKVHNGVRSDELSPIQKKIISYLSENGAVERSILCKGIDFARTTVFDNLIKL